MNSQSNSLITPQIVLSITITEKTAALIDNIFVNGQARKQNSGNIIKPTSDHLPQFIITENAKGDNPANKTAKTTYRDYKHFDIVSFKTDLQDTDWTFATHSNDINLGFEAFQWLFNTTLAKHATIKELTKKKKKKIN